MAKPRTENGVYNTFSEGKPIAASSTLTSQVRIFIEVLWFLKSEYFVFIGHLIEWYFLANFYFLSWFCEKMGSLLLKFFNSSKFWWYYSANKPFMLEEPILFLFDKFVLNCIPFFELQRKKTSTKGEIMAMLCRWVMVLIYVFLIVDLIA